MPSEMTFLSIEGATASPASSVGSWLEQLPEQPVEYCSPNSSQKRSRSQTGGERKRRALVPLSPNAMPPLRNSPVKIVPQLPPSTPQRKRARKAAQHPTSASATFLHELEDTPRASELNVTPPSSLLRHSPSRPANTAPSIPATSPEKDIEVASTTTQDSEISIVSTFCVKKVADFDQTTQSVEQIEFEDYDPPPSVVALVKDLNSIRRERRMLPERLLLYPPINKLYDSDDLEDIVAPSSVQWLQRLNLADERSIGKLWERLVECRGYARDCELHGSYEAEWNEQVHSNLLRLILKGPWREHHIWYRNITQARIEGSQQLLPHSLSNDKPITPKLIDFAIVYDPPQSALHSIKRRLLRAFKSLNQTEAPSVRTSPIAINIETKLGAVKEEEGLIQLLTWCAAQFNKLQQLNNSLENTDLLPMPLVFIQGHSWRFLIAEKMNDDSIRLVKYLRLGESDNMRGMLQIAAAVERLAYWTETEFIVWWRAKILNPFG